MKNIPNLLSLNCRDDSVISYNMSYFLNCFKWIKNLERIDLGSILHIIRL